MLLHAYLCAWPVLENPSFHACRHMAHVALNACSLSLALSLSLSRARALSLSLFMDAYRRKLLHTPALAFDKSPDMGAFVVVISLARMPARAAGRRLRAQQFILLLLHTDAEEGGEGPGERRAWRCKEDQAGARKSERERETSEDQRGGDQREREPCRVQQPRRLQPPHRHACAPLPAA